MTKSTITRERLEEIVSDPMINQGSEFAMMARMALAAMDNEPNRNPVLAYADSYRDMAKQGVESVPIWSVITDLERNIAPLYRHAQPVPVVPYDFDFDRFNDVVWLECVASNPHMHSPTTSIIARVALELNKRILAGNSQVIPGAEKRISDAVELLKKAAPAMLADNSGPDGPLAGRMKSPVIPEGYAMVPKEPTAQMYDAGDRQMATKQVWDAMLAAAPQEVKGE